MTEPPDPDPWSQNTKDRWFYLTLAISFASVLIVFWPYLYVLLFAAVTVVVCWPVYSRILKWVRGRAFVASLLTTTLLGLLVFGPLGLVLVLFALEVQSVTAQAIQYVQSGQLESTVDQMLKQLELPTWLQDMLPAMPELDLGELGPGHSLEPLAGTEGIPELARHAVDAVGSTSGGAPAADVWADGVLQWMQREALRLGVEATPSGGIELWLSRLELIEEDLWTGAQDATLSALRFAGAEIPGVIQAAVDLSIDSVIYVFAVVTLFTNGPRLLTGIKRLSPLDDRYEQRLFDVFGEFSRNLVVGSLATAAIQGLIAGLGYAFAGVGNVLFLAILTGIGSFVPVVGTVVIWVPVVGFLLVNGSYGAAIFLALWCLILVGSIDNVLKPLFMRGNTDIHPLLVFLAVFGGLYWMGLTGLFVGPVLVAFFLALYTIYESEFLGIEPEVEDAEPSWIARRLSAVLQKVGLQKASEKVTEVDEDLIDKPIEPEGEGGEDRVDEESHEDEPTEG